MAWPRIKEIVQNLVAGGLIVQTSNALDFNNEEMRPYLDRFYRGSNGYEAVEKQKVINYSGMLLELNLVEDMNCMKEIIQEALKMFVYTHYLLQRKPDHFPHL